MENITRTAQETIGKIPQIAQDATSNLEKSLQSVAENLAPIMDRLAGTQSNMNLSFNDLTLDTGTSKAKISGSIHLEFTYAEEADAFAKSQTGSAKQIDKTVVTDVS